MLANCFILALIVSICQAGYAGSYTGNYVGPVGGGGFGGGYGGGYGNAFVPGFNQQFYPIPFDFASLMAGTNAKAYTSVSVEPPFNGKISAHSRIIFHGLNQLQARLQQAAQTSHSSGGGTGGAFAYSGSYPGPYGGGTNSFAAPPPSYTPTTRSFSGTSRPYIPQPPVVNSRHGGSFKQPFSNSGFSGGYGGGYGGSYGGGYGGAFGGSYGGVPHNLATFPRGPGGPGVPGVPGGYIAGASASIGGGAVKQTAFLNPANPASPNVNVRYAGGSTPNGSSKSVFVSSSSSSGNINGTPYHQRHASSTINDNGKVSTYTVHDK